MEPRWSSCATRASGYWKELHVALPPSVGLARFDDRVDITQLGVVALVLILGRPLHEDEYPGAIEDLVSSASARSVEGDHQPLTSELRSWLRRALQLQGQSSFRTVVEAKTALEQLLAEESGYTADIGALEGFLARYHESVTPGSAGRTAHARPVRPTESRIEPPMAVITQPDEEEEEEDESSEPMASTSRGLLSGRNRWIARGLVATCIVGAGLFAGRQYFAPAAKAVTNGTLAVDTTPPGAQVFVDGTARGLTPVSLSLPPGPHTLIVQGNGEPRAIPVMISQGALSSQYLEFREPSAVAFGQLHIVTEPNGARVTVDGVAKGTTPLTVAELTPGEHAVTLESEMGPVNHKVIVEAGNTASLVVPLRVAPSSGWVSVTSAVQMELYERGRLLGNSGIDRIMLEAGKHDIEIVNEPLGYRVTRSIQVAPGRVSPLSIDLPKGVISLNAVPWANVSIDGENVGETPIGNLSLPIGWHEVVFRNPQFGEQRRAVTVTLRAPARLSIDLTTK